MSTAPEKTVSPTSSPAMPVPPLSQIQTDTFCEKCGYNLFTQPVSRDDRLGILVARCPECGAWHAAGKSSSVGRVWLNRLGTALIFWWVVFLVGIWALHLLFMGIVHAVFVEAHIVFVSGWSRGYEYVFRADSSPEAIRGEQILSFVLYAAMAFLGYSLGAMTSVFLWHLAKKVWRFLAMLWPIVPVALVWFSWHTPYMPWHITTWLIVHTIAFFLVAALGAIFGLATGRFVARGLLRLLLPVKLLQHLDFLWRIDGKTPPTQDEISPSNGPVS